MSNADKNKEGDSSKTTPKRRKKLSKESIDRAIEWRDQASSPRAKSVSETEMTLTLLISNNLPATEWFVFNGVYQARTFSNAEEFNKMVKSSDKVTSLIDTTDLNGNIVVILDKGYPEFYLFHEKNITREQRELYFQLYQFIISLCYSSLNLELKDLTKNKNFLADFVQYIKKNKEGQNKE